MKLLPLLAALLFSTGFACADYDTNVRDLQTLQTPKLPAAELKRISFTAELAEEGSDPLYLSLHNPFRDKSIRGVVLGVQWKLADGRERTVEVFSDLTCGPLQTSANSTPILDAKKIAKHSPVITLKEVHIEAQAEAVVESSGSIVEKLRRPTFSPEEMKQIPFDWTLFENSRSLGIELHNPFRDKSIRGVVLQVRFKSPAGKEQTLELYNDVECLPLHRGGESIQFFHIHDAVKESIMVTLKEVFRGE